MSEWIPFIPYLVVAGAIALFGLLMIGASLLEKQRIRQFEAVGKETIAPTSSYFDAMNEAAGRQGFAPSGTYGRMPRTSGKSVYMAGWLSPDQTTLACILGGKVAKINYRKTLLMSWLEAERVLVTVDNFGETDHSGTMDIEVLVNADFSELTTRHAERLRACSTQPILLDSDQVVTYWERLEETRARRLVALGLARFQDEPGGIWRYTLKGGWKNFIAGINGVKKAKLQAERMKMKRPGS
jgi:hypothetical protein